MMTVLTGVMAASMTLKLIGRGIRCWKQRAVPTRKGAQKELMKLR
uniref:Uncharacterized protein n=1 Tax=Anguilla anguilla TaxID=7936 RepID=A0A0E9VV15_ANGAN